MQDWQQRQTRVAARLRRVEGQVRALHDMVLTEDDCERVMQQMAAARKALDRSFYELVACVLERALADARPDKSRLAEITQLLACYA
ncbi:MAG: metal-sensitive transcriptional regulator [Gammaproteobacteria bacterium]